MDVGSRILQNNQKRVRLPEKTARNVTTGFPAKWRQRNKQRNSILMTCRYPDQGSPSDWLQHISLAANSHLLRFLEGLTRLFKTKATTTIKCCGA